MYGTKFLFKLKKKKKIPSNSLNIFILSVNFENLTIKLHVLIIF